jgi:hypothetical protein
MRHLRADNMPLKLHALFSMMNETGGSVTTRLVSEEDLSLFFVFIAPEDFTLYHVSETPALEVHTGEQLQFTLNLHLTDQGRRCTQEELARFFPPEPGKCPTCGQSIQTLA